MSRPRLPLLAVVGPGLLIAATGVGAGDLATAGFAGSHLGTAILWAVVVGAFLKFVINEGLTRWQLVTGETLLEGAVLRLGRGVAWVFLPYLLLWSFLVPTALMSACGVAFQSILALLELPAFDDPTRGKLVFGLAHSAVGVVLVLLGGFRLFERVMSVCIAVMFTTVVVTGALLLDSAGELFRGLLVPTIPDFSGAGLDWTVALVGGIGGTLTVLCYGYWIREEGREGVGEMATCRLDLAIGYLMTALFGIAMIIIASRVSVDERGVRLIMVLGESLREPLGPVAQWAFLGGAWCAIFSSLLGVWQATPYLFADFWQLLRRGEAARVDTRGRPYRGTLFAIAVVPALGLLLPFQTVQKITGIAGAFCMPLIAAALLLLNTRTDLIGERYRNRRPTTVILALVLLFFAWLFLRKLLPEIIP